MSGTDMCVICGGPPNGRRYGPIACLGCIVFFRRAVRDEKLGECEKHCRYQGVSDLKFICRSCRYRQCLVAGMDPKAIKMRDKLGPRKPKLTNFEPTKISADKFFETLLLLQKKQRSLHRQHCKPKLNIAETLLMMKQKLYRRAGPYDVNLALKLGFQNAAEWANQFESFWNFKLQDKKMVLAEFDIAYTLVDQASKTVSMADKGFWLLQNDSYLHPDCFFNMSLKEKTYNSCQTSARKHFDFVHGLIQRICKPFTSLQIDKLECVILKILLLLTPSFPGKIKVVDTDGIIPKCMAKLMSHCLKKSPKEGVVRFGEIILLIRSIRCAVKCFYNHTKESTLFDLSNFDPFVRASFLS